MCLSQAWPRSRTDDRCKRVARHADASRQTGGFESRCAWDGGRPEARGGGHYNASAPKMEARGSHRSGSDLGTGVGERESILPELGKIGSPASEPSHPLARARTGPAFHGAHNPDNEFLDDERKKSAPK